MQTKQKVKFLKTKDIKEMFGVTDNTLYMWRRKEGMPYYGSGPGIRYIEEEVLEGFKKYK